MWFMVGYSWLWSSSRVRILVCIYLSCTSVYFGSVMFSVGSLVRFCVRCWSTFMVRD